MTLKTNDTLFLDFIKRCLAYVHSKHLHDCIPEQAFLKSVISSNKLDVTFFIKFASIVLYERGNHHLYKQT